MNTGPLGRYSQMWQAHVSACPDCKRVDLDRPATLALCCIPGARIFKDLADVAARELARERRAA